MIQQALGCSPDDVMIFLHVVISEFLTSNNITDLSLLSATDQTLGKSYSLL